MTHKHLEPSILWFEVQMFMPFNSMVYKFQHFQTWWGPQLTPTGCPLHKQPRIARKMEFSCMLCLTTLIANKSIFHKTQSNQTWTNKKQEIVCFFNLFVVSLICIMGSMHGSMTHSGWTIILYKMITNLQKLDHLGSVALPNHHRFNHHF